MFEKIAYAAEVAQEAPQVNPMVQLFPILLMFAIFYFMLIRPQQKKQKELQKMVSELKKGDKVITNGGLIGTISSIQEDYFVLTLGDADAKAEVLKSAVVGLRK
ncbi:MAG: preprotein translocase subunit YajC [Candidatus Omnitrophica bacterium]|nr:preprotein translocase subunit YajC [Candidatus Omnitrophota bacterium]